MYQLVDVVLGCSSFSPVRARVHGLEGRSLRLIIPAGLIIGALVIAPEEPDQQASICLRHHSPAACRVW